MSRTLHTPFWKRVRDLRLTLGPLGAAVTLDLDSRAEDVIALVPEVEQAIDRQFGITYFTDPELQVGQWFQITETPMIYDIINEQTTDGVLFMGQESRRFLLGGSAEYLLDRRIPDEVKVRDTLSSTLVGIWGLIDKLADYDRARDDKHADNIADRLARPIGGWAPSHSFSWIFRGLLNGTSPEPLSTLARCLSIDIARDDDKVTVIGTPLYVAFAAPN
jgi:hypothetical protein